MTDSKEDSKEKFVGQKRVRDERDYSFAQYDTDWMIQEIIKEDATIERPYWDVYKLPTTNYYIEAAHRECVNRAIEHYKELVTSDKFISRHFIDERKRSIAIKETVSGDDPSSHLYDICATRYLMIKEMKKELINMERDQAQDIRIIEEAKKKRYG